MAGLFASTCVSQQCPADRQVPIATTVNNLGVTVYAQLSMKPHVDKVVRNCFYHLRHLRSVRRSLPEDALLCSPSSTPSSRVASTIVTLRCTAFPLASLALSRQCSTLLRDRQQAFDDTTTSRQHFEMHSACYRFISASSTRSC